MDALRENLWEVENSIARLIDRLGHSLDGDDLTALMKAQSTARKMRGERCGPR